MFRKILLPIAALTLLLSACATPTARSFVQPTAASTSVPAVEPTAVPTEAPTAEPTAEPIVLTDSLGREVTLAAPAQSIVSLAPSNTEILFALGAGGLLIGRDDFSDYPPEAAGVPSVGSLYPNVNAEAIVALQPDLVLAAGITNPDDVKALADLGLTVYTTSVAANMDDIFNDILAVGRLVGRDTEAATLVTSLKARADAVINKAGGVEPVKVFYEIDATDPASPWTTGPGSFIEQLLALAGGQNIGNVSQEQYFQISLEELVTQDPDIIILGSATYGGQTPELVAARNGWSGISAVKNNRVYAFDDNLVSRPGPRVVDGLEKLAELLHPELFTP